jgi:hypothetical protein
MRLELELAQSYGEELTKKLNTMERRIKVLVDDIEKKGQEVHAAEVKCQEIVAVKDDEIKALIEKVNVLASNRQKSAKGMVSKQVGLLRCNK